MTGKPRNFSQAIDELESHSSDDTGDIRARLEAELRRIEETLKNLKPHVDEIKQRVSDEALKAKDRVEDQVVKNPWAALGIVGLIFFVVGFVFGFSGSRRRD